MSYHTYEQVFLLLWRPLSVDGGRGLRWRQSPEDASGVRLLGSPQQLWPPSPPTFRTPGIPSLFWPSSHQPATGLLCRVMSTEPFGNMLCAPQKETGTSSEMIPFRHFSAVAAINAHYHCVTRNVLNSGRRRSGGLSWKAWTLSSPSHCILCCYCFRFFFFFQVMGTCCIRL